MIVARDLGDYHVLKCRCKHCSDPDEMRLEVVTLGEDGITESDIAIHDETNRGLATMLAQMDPPDFPVALGVLYADPAPTYETSVHAQIEQAAKDGATADLNQLLQRGQTWTVE